MHLTGAFVKGLQFFIYLYLYCLLKNYVIQSYLHLYYIILYYAKTNN